MVYPKLFMLLYYAAIHSAVVNYKPFCCSELHTLMRPVHKPQRVLVEYDSVSRSKEVAITSMVQFKGVL